MSPREGECDCSISSCQGLTWASENRGVDTGKLIIECTHCKAPTVFIVLTCIVVGNSHTVISIVVISHYVLCLCTEYTCMSIV